MEFIYTGIDQNSTKQKGKLEANNDREVIEFLRANGITPLSVRKIEKGGLALFGGFNKVKTGDIVIFTRQLASMIQTGLTLIEALSILKQQKTSF